MMMWMNSLGILFWRFNAVLVASANIFIFY